MIQNIRIATRQSRLALWQSEYVADTLRRAHPGIEIEIIAMTTRGDQILDRSLAKVGGKGLGLALVAKVIGDHGGVIEIDSEPRRTAVRVMLPMVPREARAP